MITLHAFFYPWSNQWDTYSAPVSIYSGGVTLDEARARFREAGAFYFAGAWPSVEIIEHVEREVSPGLVVRVAQDSQASRRTDLADALEVSYRDPAAATAAWGEALEAGTGDVVLVCCEPGDKLSWVGEQLGRIDAVHVVARVPDGGVTWVPLVAPGRELPAEQVRTFADLGLDPHTATVADLLAAVGHPLDTGDAGRETALLAAV